MILLSVRKHRQDFWFARVIVIEKLPPFEVLYEKVIVVIGDTKLGGQLAHIRQANLCGEFLCRAIETK